MFSSARDLVESMPAWAKYAAAASAAVAIPAMAYMALKRKRRSPYKTDWEEGVVYLYQFPRSTCIPSVSPFCLKVETWLRMADIRYENVDIPFSVRSKEGQLPFVELNGTEYCDSQFIIRDLSKVLQKESLEAHLSLQEKGTSRAFEKLTENSLLWSYAAIRYGEKLKEVFSKRILGFEPPLILKLIPQFVMTKQVKKALYITGMGRHPRDEIIGIGLDDLRAISMYLGDKTFFHGARPTRVDATLFGTLAQMVYIPIETPHTDFIDTECKNVKEYCEQMKKRFWPDWTEALSKRSLHTNWKST